MNCVDTPLLEQLLDGEANADLWLNFVERSGEEVCTTEANLLELEILSKRRGAIGFRQRTLALDRLRGSVTVLPMVPSVSRTVGHFLRRKGSTSDRPRGKRKTGVRDPLLLSLIFGIALQHGVTTFLTTHPTQREALRWGLRVKIP